MGQEEEVVVVVTDDLVVVVLVVVVVVVVVFVVVVDVVPLQVRMLQLYCPIELQTQVLHSVALQLLQSTVMSVSGSGVQLVEACIDNEVEFL